MAERISVKLIIRTDTNGKYSSTVDNKVGGGTWPPRCNHDVAEECEEFKPRGFCIETTVQASIVQEDVGPGEAMESKREVLW
jgi:hypothetical protein